MRMRQSEERKARNMTALQAKAQAGPAVTMARPAAEGPRKRAVLEGMEVMATAPGRARGGTRLEMIDRRAGWLNAVTTPWNAVNANRCQMVSQPPKASPARVAAWAIKRPWVMRDTLRPSWRSTTAPAMGATKVEGKKPAE